MGLPRGRGIKLAEVEGLVGTPLHFRLNPYTTAYSCVIIWGFIIYTISHRWEAYKEFQTWFQWVTDEWTWLYIGSQNVWIGVLLYLLCSKYRKIKFGGPADVPEFSRAQWFSMLYCCGVAVGLFYYGVAEPLWHFHPEYPRARWVGLNDHERANHALMITYFHWGFHGWVPYVVIGALMSLMSYRRGLPMTMRSCFYPLWGKGIEGWKGDVVDVLSIVCTLFGVCTSLGLGVRQLNKGLVRLDRGTYAGKDVFGLEWGSNPPQSAACSSEPCTKGRLGIEFDVRTQVIIVWCVTALATISVVAGLKRGIANLSYAAFGMGMILLVSVLFMDDTMYILDAMTTSFGYYLWYLPKVAWETDAWARLGADHSWSRNGAGTAASIVVEGVHGGPDGLGAQEDWMHAWTIFYWGWWISWAPFVGTFLARISKGRTLGEFITFTLIMPVLYCVLWFGVFGGAAIRMQFDALKATRGTADGGDIAMADCGFSDLRSTRLEGGGFHAKHNSAYTVNLWCLGTEDIFFDMLGSYGSRELSYALTGFSWVCLLLYFITSSDSGSYVIDMIAANGHEKPPAFQRVLWALTEGAAATALLKGGGGDPDRALKSLQAVSVVGGLPFTIVLMYMSHALYVACLEEAGDLAEDRPNFRTACLDMSHDIAKRLYVCTFFPFVSVWKVLTKLDDAMTNAYAALAGLVFYFAGVLLLLAPIEANLRMISAASYMAFASIVCYCRYATRRKLNIQTGDIVTDYCIAVLFYPLALSQCEREIDLGPHQLADAADDKGAFRDGPAAVADEGGVCDADIEMTEALVDATGKDHAA